MVERIVMVEVAIPGRDIAVRPLAAARADPQPGVECRPGAVHKRRCRLRCRFRFSICRDSHFPHSGVFCDVAGMLDTDHPIPVEMSGFIRPCMQCGIVYHHMHEWPANDDQSLSRFLCKRFMFVYVMYGSRRSG